METRIAAAFALISAFSLVGSGCGGKDGEDKETKPQADGGGDLSPGDAKDVGGDLALPEVGQDRVADTPPDLTADGADLPGPDLAGEVVPDAALELSDDVQPLPDAPPGDLSEIVPSDLPIPSDVGDETVCQPDTTFCLDDSTLATCSQDGMSYVEEDCGLKHVCVGAECVSWLCIPGEPLCDGAFATLCNDQGSGPAAGGEDCALSGKYCIGGECIACFPDCFGKMCGDDGCGGSCGDCDDDNPCSKDTCEVATFVCKHSPVKGCCLADSECDDKDACTADSCVNNTCVQGYLCCDAHADCEDADTACTQDLCLNEFCWHKLIPGGGCCPKTVLDEGFELKALWGWKLSGDGQKSWALSDKKAYSGTISLTCDKQNSTAVALLPTLKVPSMGATLAFQYFTEGWTAPNCTTEGVQITINGAKAALVCQPAESWAEFLVDLEPWSGDEIQVRIHYVMGQGGANQNAVFIDDLRLIEPCCINAWSCDDGDPCTKETCNPDGTCTHELLAGCCTPAMLQEDFELGTAWEWTLSADGKKSWGPTTEDAHTGAWSLMAGEPNNGAAATLPGGFVIPASGAALKFWYRSANWNVITWGSDGLGIIVNGQLASVISTPATSWTAYSFDLAPWAGKEIVLQLRYQVLAGGNQGHKVYLDDLQISRKCCSSDQQCDDGNECTADTCGTMSGCVHEPDPTCCQKLQYSESFDSGVAWKWALSADGNLDWKLVGDQALSGSYSLYADGWDNGAVATLPFKPTIPWSGAHLRFYYKSANWQALDCAKDGVTVYVNGAVVGSACTAAADWTMFEADLRPWGGKEVVLQLRYAMVSVGNDGHKVWVDDVTIENDCCNDSGDCDDGNTCTTDKCNGEQCSYVADAQCCNPDLWLESFELGSWGWSLTQDGYKKWALAGDASYKGLYSLTCTQGSNGAVATLPPLQVPVAGAGLEFQYKNVNWLVVDCNVDGLVVYVNGARVAVACEITTDWKSFGIDLTPWKGKEVTVQLAYSLSPVNYGHAIYVDEFMLKAVCCKADAECSDGNPCTLDDCGTGGGCINTEKPGCCLPTWFKEGFEPGSAWGWTLTADNVVKWAVTSPEAHTGLFSLMASNLSNKAQATLPVIGPLPWNKPKLTFWYKTVDWVVLDCATMGLSVSVNGAGAAQICQSALDWTQATVDLYPWAGQEVTIRLRYNVADANNPNHALYADDFEVTAVCK
jgi:hypothetical protein